MSPEVAGELSTAVATVLPIRTFVSEVTLLAEGDGQWRIGSRWPLG